MTNTTATIINNGSIPYRCYKQTGQNFCTEAAVAVDDQGNPVCKEHDERWSCCPYSGGRFSQETHESAECPNDCPHYG